MHIENITTHILNAYLKHPITYNKYIWDPGPAVDPGPVGPGPGGDLGMAGPAVGPGLMVDPGPVPWTRAHQLHAYSCSNDEHQLK